MRFRDEYYFLSNMFPCKITYNGFTYNNAEAAFQAQKDLTRMEEFTCLDGYSAKKLGKTVNLRPDWNNVKLTIMREILTIKFADKQLAAKLKSINTPIVEDNTWGDRYWGVCNGVGENHLGKILMDIQSGRMCNCE